MSHNLRGRSVRTLAALLIVLSALPFIAVPVGANTHIPISSIFSALLIFACRRMHKLLAIGVAIAMIPIVSGFFRMFFTPVPWQPAETFTWVVFTLPFAGAAAASLVLRERAIPWLSWTILFSALFVVIQKHVFFDLLKTVPFVSFYQLPGYWTPTEDLTIFLTYVGRPFGLFPESSFMAGTLSLMAMVLIVTALHYRYRLRLRDFAAIVLVLWAVAISGSGTTVAVLGVLMLAVLIPAAKQHAKTTFTVVPTALVIIIVVAAEKVAERQSGFNWSWFDRYSSIAASARLMLNDPSVLWLGLGRGQANAEFLNGNMPLDSYQHYNPIPDIYSVIGRVLLEYGLILGLPFLVCLFVLILRAGGAAPLWLGACSIVIWVVISGMAISYDSAFWIWGIAGWFMGLEMEISAAQRPNSNRLFPDNISFSS